MRKSGVRTCYPLDLGGEEWSGREDLNLRPPAPKAGALPGCATPRHFAVSFDSKSLRIWKPFPSLASILALGAENGPPAAALVSRIADG